MPRKINRKEALLRGKVIVVKHGSQATNCDIIPIIRFIFEVGFDFLKNFSHVVSFAMYYVRLYEFFVSKSQIEICIYVSQKLAVHGVVEIPYCLRRIWGLLKVLRSENVSI